MAKRKPAKRGPIAKAPRPGKSFEDVVRHVLKAGPMPKATRKRAKRVQ